jgi:hypothetical protein
MLAVAVVGGLAIAWYQYNWVRIIRGQITYHTLEVQLLRKCERELREVVTTLRAADEAGEDTRALTDKVFELVVLGMVANNSKEVYAARRAAHSDERTSVALKWADAVIAEFDHRAKCHEIWKRDYERGKESGHIPYEGTTPFGAPGGWTLDDRMY